MVKKSVAEISPEDIGQVVSFVVPNPVLTKINGANATLKVTGVLVGYIKSSPGTDLVLEVGNSKHVINEVLQQVMDISFPLKSE